MQMTIYDAATVGSRSNCVYPNPVTVTDADTMRQAAAFDHVCAAYKQNYRSVDNFLKADCLPMDCDNDHSDDPDDWLTPFDVAMDFPGVGMIFVYSRSHMKPKGKRGPRPRFHVYFICTETTDAALYSSWKDKLIADYPYFDDGAKDSARFLFGVKNAAVEVYDGEITIDEFLADSFAEWDAAQGQIPEGSRNKTMSHYAGRIIKRLGNTEEAHKQFLKEAEKCSPPLDDAELAGIWASAVKFGAKVAAQEGYIPPEQYNQDLIDRYNRGEMVSADSIHFPDSLKTRTLRLGRTVYGGGGIMPDYFIPLDTTMYTDYYLDLRNKGAIVQENLKLIDRHRNEWIKKYKTFDRFNRDFEITEEMLSELVETGKNTGAKYDEAQYLTALPLIKTQLKALIARDLWDMSEYFQVINELSDSMKKAIELLEKPGLNFPKRD